MATIVQWQSVIQEKKRPRRAKAYIARVYCRGFLQAAQPCQHIYMPPLNHIPPRSQCIKRACHPAPAFVEHMGINHRGAHIAMP